jgi:mono/diheme cytochrome c family protein
MANLPLARIGLLTLALLPLTLALIQPGFGAPKSAGGFKEVQQIFKAHCFSCHKGSQAAAGLDLSTVTGIAKGGMSGKVFVPGKPDSSLLVKRVMGSGGMPRMPMGFAPLTDDQMKSIRGWIASGAKMTGSDSQHWAYIVPERPSIPKPKNSAWVKNPIDAFIVSRLERGALKPSPEAPRETLVRRLYLDLTGLPPSPEQVDLFLNDRSPQAYERMVKELLASPHFGERQARIWLDLARYADSNGYEADAGRVAWKYRDWVIDAYNRNMPYDQFTVEQLAGDLLPGPSLDQLIATGFHRNTMLNLEGGVDPKEARYEMVNDRVATTSQVWLGQTMQCARCHDHKYDPISQKDYFRMYAIFANTSYESRGDAKVGQEKYYEPSIPAPTPEQLREKTAIEANLAALRKSLAEETPEYVGERATFVRQLKANPVWRSAEASGENLTQLPGNVLRAPEANAANVVYQVRFRAPSGTRALRVDVLPDPSLPKQGPGRSENGNFILSRAALSVDGKSTLLVDPESSYVQGGYSLAGLFDADPNTGWAIAPRSGEAHWLVLRLKNPLPHDANVSLDLAHESPAWPRHAFYKFAVRVSTEPNQMFHTMSEAVREALAQKANPELDPKLNEYFQSISTLKALVRKRVAETEGKLTALGQAIPMAMVMREKPGSAQLTAPLHIRGEFLQPGPPVAAGIPAAFGKTEAKRVDRLALAKWLVDKKNPLTARVEVNRIWEQYFGRGIVESSENWGVPGTPPSHPELLDWLAREFMDSGWNRKHIHKLIVTSATYRQSSKVSKAMLERDPTNRLFARAGRYRMEAEMIRDNALAIAGLLSRRVGGASVFPHQPDGVWNNPYSGERWTTSAGENLYRRGLYTFWKRTATYPTFVNFDATSREACTIRRGTTNTPLQALNLLNDPAFFEAAKGLAKQTEATNDSTQRIRQMFRRCTSRYPDQSESDRMQVLLDSLRTKFEARPEEAKKLAADPDSAAWVMLANVILNLDETITKE